MACALEEARGTWDWSFLIFPWLKSLEWATIALRVTVSSTFWRYSFLTCLVPLVFLDSKRTGSGLKRGSKTSIHEARLPRLASSETLAGAWKFTLVEGPEPCHVTLRCSTDYFYVHRSGRSASGPRKASNVSRLGAGPLPAAAFSTSRSRLIPSRNGPLGNFATRFRGLVPR